MTSLFDTYAAYARLGREVTDTDSWAQHCITYDFVFITSNCKFFIEQGPNIEEKLLQGFFIPFLTL